LKSSIEDIGWPTGIFDGKIIPSSGLAFSTNLPSRKVNLGGANLIELKTADRKNGAGAINNMFYGSISTTMARYLQTKLGISEFKNANIYGNYDQWNGGNITSKPPTSPMSPSWGIIMVVLLSLLPLKVY
jgi:hypothetical protein